MPDFDGAFLFPTSVQSLPVIAINRNITSAVLLASGADLTNITFYMSANNGTTFEQVNRNSAYTFTTTGSILLWKADGTPGSQITWLSISGVQFV